MPATIPPGNLIWLSLLRTDESELSADDADTMQQRMRQILLVVTRRKPQGSGIGARVLEYRIWTIQLRGDAHEVIVDVDKVVLALTLVVVKALKLMWRREKKQPIAKVTVTAVRLRYKSYL